MQKFEQPTRKETSRARGSLARLAVTLGHLVEERGFVFVAQSQPEMATADFADCIGTRDIIGGVPPVQTLTPKSIAASAPNLYSGHFGYGAFPFHTDLAHWFVPPRFILLRCKCGDDRVYTSILSWARALRGLPLSTLRRARFRPRRPVNGRVQLLPFCQVVDEGWLWRWDSVFLKPDNEEAAALARHLAQMQVEDSGEKVVLRHPGDMLIIDNWRVLHGRSRVRGSVSTRLLERIYLREIGVNGKNSCRIS